MLEVDEGVESIIPAIDELIPYQQSMLETDRLMDKKLHRSKQDDLKLCIVGKKGELPQAAKRYSA
jgi:hypothetical protein